MHTLDVAGNINDPLLFPGKLGQDEMKNLPPAVLSTSEFDFMRRDVHMVIPEMKKAGIYLDHMDYSGVCHMFQVYPDDPQTILWFADMKKAIAAYLLCWKHFDWLEIDETILDLFSGWDISRDKWFGFQRIFKFDQ